MQKCSVAKFNIALAPVGVEPVDKSLKDTEDCGLQNRDHCDYSVICDRGEEQTRQREKGNISKREKGRLFGTIDSII